MPDLTLTNRELLEAAGNGQIAGPLAKLAEQPLPNIKTTYWLTRLVRAVQGPIADVEKARLVLLDQCAKKDAEGKQVLVEGTQFVDLADPAAFHAGWESLLDESVTLNGVRAIEMKELDHATLSATDLMRLGPMVTGELE